MTKKKYQVPVKVAMTAIITIGVLEAIALIMGRNGTLLMIAVAAVGGIAGWVFPQPKIPVKK